MDTTTNSRKENNLPQNNNSSYLSVSGEVCIATDRTERPIVHTPTSKSVAAKLVCNLPPFLDRDSQPSSPSIPPHVQVSYQPLVQQSASPYRPNVMTLIPPPSPACQLNPHNRAEHRSPSTYHGSVLETNDEMKPVSNGNSVIEEAPVVPVNEPLQAVSNLIAVDNKENQAVKFKVCGHFLYW